MQIRQLKEEDLPQHRVIISGGGTGGHIFPAIAIARALQKLEPGIELLFVGAEGRMEMEKVPAAGFKIEGLKISGIKRELSFENLSWPFKLLKSLNKASSIIDKFKPQAAVGVGGYASGPLLYKATAKKIPSLIQEQNSYPGITNKLLAKRVQKICVAYDNMNNYFPDGKIIKTGNPVREDILHIEGKKDEASSHFGLRKDKITILVVGGSQGARSINLSVRNGLKKLSDADVQLIWQTGKLFLPEAQKSLSEINNPSLKAFDFISRMDLAYAMCDLVIARGGASTVSELCIVARPAILVPLPTAAEDHQTKNCLALTEKNAAIMVKDIEVAEKLIDAALDLAKNKSLQEQLIENIKPLAITDSAERIAKEVLSMIKN
jgi:UDP-N-acetylglucosamine--N-acetylmuramyl-(pentapeptide) pyrophosphoryl-undecaprenol N-acetylglucosamine transferase